MSWKTKKPVKHYEASVAPEFLERAEAAGMAEWFELIERQIDGFSMTGKDGLVVIAAVSEELDGKRWAHVSLSFKSYIPAYATMAMVKRVFIGDDLKAIQVFPRKEEHVNLCSTALHLFACLDGDPLPDFTRGTRSL